MLVVNVSANCGEEVDARPWLYINRYEWYLENTWCALLKNRSILQKQLHSTYKVEVFEAAKRKEFSVKFLQNVMRRFESVSSLQSALWNEFGDIIPDEGDYIVGYFDGRQHTKKWLMTRQDLDAMYIHTFSGENTCQFMVWWQRNWCKWWRNTCEYITQEGSKRRNLSKFLCNLRKSMDPCILDHNCVFGHEWL